MSDNLPADAEALFKALARNCENSNNLGQKLEYHEQKVEQMCEGLEELKEDREELVDALVALGYDLNEHRDLWQPDKNNDKRDSQSE